jgi:hypothetical protein
VKAVPVFLALVLSVAATARAQTKPLPDFEPPIALARISSPIHVDGDLSDPGWREAAKVETWYESNVGDNVPPPVRTIAYVGNDARFFYVAFDCRDPNPAKIRAPYVSPPVIPRSGATRNLFLSHSLRACPERSEGMTAARSDPSLRSG